VYIWKFSSICLFESPLTTASQETNPVVANNDIVAQMLLQSINTSLVGNTYGVTASASVNGNLMTETFQVTISDNDKPFVSKL